MDLYRLSVVVHIFLSIILVGFALFWVIMYTALGRRFASQETERLMGIVKQARWPHVAVPWQWRLRLPWLASLTLIALWGTGVANAKLHGTPEGPLWWTKMALFLLIIGCQVLWSRRSSAPLGWLNFALVLVMVVVSGWVIR